MSDDSLGRDYHSDPNPPDEIRKRFKMSESNMPEIAESITLPDFTGGRLSPTQIDMYQRCPLQYFHRYVEGRKVPPGVALVEGSAHHAALETNNRYKIREHEDLPTPRLIERFQDEFDTRKGEIENWEGESSDSVVHRGRGLLKEYLNSFAPTFQPNLVEHEFEIRVGAIPVIGYMDAAGDRVGTDAPNSFVGRKSAKSEVKVVTAVDYKVAARAKSESEVANSLQLGFYGWGLQHILTTSQGTKCPIEAGFCILKKTKTPAVEWQSSIITPARLKWLRQVVTYIADAITKGVFPPCDPTSWCCSEKFCGFYQTCRGRFDK